MLINKSTLCSLIIQHSWEYRLNERFFRIFSQKCGGSGFIFVYYILIINNPFMNNKKIEYLRASGTLNSRPERVTDPLFSDSSFFDARDLLQVRYEMIRAYSKHTPIKELSAQFGMSVSTYTRLRRAYISGGLQALIPAKRGPQGPHKITPEMVEFARNYRIEHGPTSIRDLTDLVNDYFKVSIHFTGLQRALSKKNA